MVASGGLGDGAGIARALQADAAGAMLGTRFVATQESRAHADYKRGLTEAASEDASLTVCFAGDWPYAAHRVLRNPTLEQWEAAGCPPIGGRPGEGDTMGHTQTGDPIRRYDETAPRRGMTGDTLAMCLYAGTSCGVIDDIPTVAELMPRLWADCEAVLGHRKDQRTQ